VDESEAPPFHDLVWGERGGEGSTPPGDFVVRRADGTSAYQLAVVVDDAAMGITEVVRGDDLLNSTARQVLLYRALDLPVPDFAHVPLLLGEDGVRLSKRHHGVTLREMRETGRSPEQVVGRLAFLLGLRDTPDPVSAAEMVNGFSFRRIGAGQGGIRVDEPFL
jgi:glutamyl-tRNA synthetase